MALLSIYFTGKTSYVYNEYIPDRKICDISCCPDIQAVPYGAVFPFKHGLNNLLILILANL